MKTKLVAAFLALNLFILYQCAENKPAPASDAMADEAMAAKTDFHGYASEAEWGHHLVTVGGCNDCHTPKKMGPHGPEFDSTLMLSGHPAGMPKIDVDRKAMEKKGYAVTMDLTEWVGPWGVSYAANLTPDPTTGTGNWTVENLFLALREGKSKGLAAGRTILPPMPWNEVTRHYTDDEIRAIFAYLRTVPPVNNAVPAPLPPASAMK